MAIEPSRTTLVHYPEPRRHHEWVSVSELRVTCPQSHVWTPDLRLLTGRGLVSCRHTVRLPGRRTCGMRMLIMLVPDFEKKLHAHVTEHDIAFMAAQRWDGFTQLAYLMTTAPRTHA
jgi:hypothetical protein